VLDHISQRRESSIVTEPALLMRSMGPCRQRTFREKPREAQAMSAESWCYALSRRLILMDIDPELAFRAMREALQWDETRAAWGADRCLFFGRDSVRAVDRTADSTW